MNVSEKFQTHKGTFEIDPGVVHHFSEGVYAKQMFLPAKYIAYSHKHEHSHLSILAQGEVIVTTDEGQETYKAPACINIKAGMNHEILALQDVIWYCIHATDEDDPEKVDEVLIGK